RRIDRVLHPVVADHQVARGARRVAEHEDLAVRQLDARRRRATREKPIDAYVFVVATRAPRACAAVIASSVSSGHLICTKWTSAGDAMPADAIASRTPASTLRTRAIVPSSSAVNGAV